MTTEDQAIAPEMEAQPLPMENDTPQDEVKDAEAPAAPANQEGNADVQDAPEDEAEKPKKPRRSAQQRINELTKQKREAEREVEFWRDKAGSAPKYDDYDTDAEYQSAISAHHSRQIQAESQEVRIKAAEEEISRAKEAEKAEVAREWHSKVAEIKARKPDFETVAYNAPISDEVSQIVAQMEKGADVAYHLGKNPDLARQISRLSPVQAAMQLGRIEAAVSRESPKVSNAPPPVKPLSGGTGAAPTDLAALDYEAYRAARMK